MEKVRATNLVKLDLESISCLAGVATSPRVLVAAATSSFVRCLDGGVQIEDLVHDTIGNVWP